MRNPCVIIYMLIKRRIYKVIFVRSIVVGFLGVFLMILLLNLKILKSWK